ncbi:DNA helicase INO80 [Acorus calamus]|uniref:DNA helicase n=1 Tax=Acorus calamus TaxID=4465 RepID=A0AAV9FET9_ACOCL|nr:DNA helicase INO80 [Acorus calamus]
MASKGPRSKLDHETRTRRQKALEAPHEPPRPKTHWDHVLEEMVWLSKDFESERKWKLAQAKKAAIRASKNMLATKGEKKMKEEEHRLRKIAMNISKDVKKFWIKIEKLVLYKHQLELEEKKKKALDKQLDFLLGQTERYSSMLAENLVDMPLLCNSAHVDSFVQESHGINGEDICNGLSNGHQLDKVDIDSDFVQSEEEVEDDEHTLEEDEALITEEERRQELAALQDEVDLPLEEILKHYTTNEVCREGSPECGNGVAMSIELAQDQTKDSAIQANGYSTQLDKQSDVDHFLVKEACPVSHKMIRSRSISVVSQHCKEVNGDLSTAGNHIVMKASDATDDDHFPHDSRNELEDQDYVLAEEQEEKDDETTISEEEDMAKKEEEDHQNEINLLQLESEIPIEELLARYKKDISDDTSAESEDASLTSEDQGDYPMYQNREPDVPLADGAIEEENAIKAEEKLPVIEEQEIKSEKSPGEGRENENIIADAAAAARSAQPTGNTFSTTKVRTKFPFLIKHPLREYQHIGLDWLVAMYEKRLNGILADEMGLGKTIMTISLLAHLACEKGIWGPHLIVVPTSVMLNWETEFLKWCPAFKILTYFGSAKERRLKRQGWLKLNYFHVCITTYRLVIQDSKIFKRKKWKYLILDEAHLIKNWKSQRWQTLLNFNSKRRILLTGTPLQNDLMELWSLMHFLMPHIFQSHQEFKDWFCNPISVMVEGQEKVNKEVVDRLHNVLRPFILRRLKRDVEKQLPKKQEHVIYCRLSRRQRNLYEDFIASSETQATLASANFFGMISVIMQLRKVCNHPDLFEGRPIISSYDMVGIDMQLSSSVCNMLSHGPFDKPDLRGLGFIFTHLDHSMTSWEFDELVAISTPSDMIMDSYVSERLKNVGSYHSIHEDRRKVHGMSIFEEIQNALLEERVKQAKERAASIAWWNSLQCQKKPVYGTCLKKLVTVKHPVRDICQKKLNPLCYMAYSSKIADIVLTPVERFQKMLHLVECFMFVIPAARAPPPTCWCSKAISPVYFHPVYRDMCTEVFSPLLSPVRPAIVRRQLYFHDRRLIQFDCGKLQELAILLRRLKSEGHRALIFTQMTKMLDILEAFINLYGYTYMRLDGSTQPEERQTLMQRFNTNPKFFLFILSTRSGGVGINLVGADTVIFYDSDWNPAMDQQAQDRCHRIGQTREVHIYRLISESTIEENILKKANKKRALDDLVIQSGSYNTEFFKKLDPMELFSGHQTLPGEGRHKGASSVAECSNRELEVLLSNADVEAALKQAEDEADYMALKKVEQEDAVDNQEFTEEATERLEDDEYMNEDDIKPDDKVLEEHSLTPSLMNDKDGIPKIYPNEDRVVTFVGRKEDVDILVDVKQLAAAAAAAGQASSSFESQLRPIDRYAMRFLDLWDPLVDKSAMESHTSFEESEWELDRIEKFKEDMEAEIDEDEEPLLDGWDADFATEAYRQHVEALAHRQLIEELECAKNAEDADDECDPNGNDSVIEYKPKSKKKTKKKKFKSLKKGSLASEPEVLPEEIVDHMLIDDQDLSADDIGSDLTPDSPVHRKAKKRKPVVASDEGFPRKISKKCKNNPKYVGLLDSCTLEKQLVEVGALRSSEGRAVPDTKPPIKSRMGGKISITTMPVKCILVVRPEKLKRRGSVWSKDCIPLPHSWSSQEDATLCAVVHEYNSHWSLVSDVLYGMPAGGFYRGRFRHPGHCCERFRELYFKYVLSAADQPNPEKNNSSSSGKALLKVTEDHVHALLDVASMQPDNDLLLQKHFCAILSSVWRARLGFDQGHSVSLSQNGLNSWARFFSSDVRQTFQRPSGLLENMSSLRLKQSGKLVATALSDVNQNSGERHASTRQQESPSFSERLDIILEFENDQDGAETHFPSVVNLSICGPSPSILTEELLSRTLRQEGSCTVAENRLRFASEACISGQALGWASSAFPTCDINARPRFGTKSQSIGKHKSASDLTKPPNSKHPRTPDPSNEPCSTSRPMLPSPITDTIYPIEGLVESPDNLMEFEYDGSIITHFLHDYDPDFYKDLVDLDIT